MIHWTKGRRNCLRLAQHRSLIQRQEDPFLNTVLTTNGGPNAQKPQRWLIILADSILVSSSLTFLSPAGRPASQQPTTSGSNTTAPCRPSTCFFYAHRHVSQSVISPLSALAANTITVCPLLLLRSDKKGPTGRRPQLQPEQQICSFTLRRLHVCHV